MQVLDDYEAFSNAVSEHASVPNGFDPPEHTAYRRLIEPFFAAEKIEAFAPLCQEIANSILCECLEQPEIEFVSGFADRFAARAQCGFLGWAQDLEGALLDWVSRSQQATAGGDREALDDVANEFARLVAELSSTSRDAQGDILGALRKETINGLPLTQEEIVSLLRNWTVGELGTISAAIGVVVHALATRPDLQEQVRGQTDLLEYAIDEILRMHGPLLFNRRRTTRRLKIGDTTIDAGERVSILWPAANRDGRVFEDPCEFRWDRPRKANLLYGHGLHVCPGAPLARLELRVATEALLSNTRWITIHPREAPRRAVFPAIGFATLPVVLEVQAI
jgi:cytochrome P450